MSPRDKSRSNPRSTLANGPGKPSATTTKPKPAPQPCPLDDAGGCDTTDTDADTGG